MKKILIAFLALSFIGCKAKVEAKPISYNELEEIVALAVQMTEPIDPKMNLYPGNENDGVLDCDDFASFVVQTLWDREYKAAPATVRFLEDEEIERNSGLTLHAVVYVYCTWLDGSNRWMYIEPQAQEGKRWSKLNCDENYEATLDLGL